MGVKTERFVYLDYLRILATLAVVTIHVAGVGWYQSDVNGFEWGVFNFFDSIVRWGIPVFVMISGVLFLKRDEVAYQYLFRKYILRMLLSFFVWSLIYYLFSGQSVSTQLAALFQEEAVYCWKSVIEGRYHLWFIPMIAGIYLCLPMIKQMVNNEKVSRYYLVVSFVAWILLPQLATLANIWAPPEVLVIINALYRKLDGMQLGFVMNNIFYFILGYELSKRKFRPEIRKLIYAMGLLGFAFTILMSWYLSIRNQVPNESFYMQNSVNVCLEAVAVFEAFKNITFKNIRINGIALRLSGWCFGIYLVHLLVLDKFLALGFTPLTFSPVAAVPIVVLVVFVVSTFISCAVNHIPVLKKYVV